MACTSLLPPLYVTWQAAPVLRRKGAPLGLKNLGNTCYLNSVLQCLTYTPPLANFCVLNLHSNLCNQLNGKNNSNCPFCFLEKRIQRSLTVECTIDAPVKIHNRLQYFAKHFRNGRQEDAHELLRYAMEACNHVCVQLHKIVHGSKVTVNKQGGAKGGSKEEPNTVVKEIFGGLLQSQVKCLSCSTESNKLDDIMDLSLDIVRLGSLNEALCRFFQPEVLDGENKYRCDQCKKLSPARKQMSVYRAPNVLVIQMKRFENIYGGKIDRHVHFEERLSLAGYMCRAGKDARPEYTLYGVVVHAGGSQDSGHYYSYVKESGGRWYCCDDASVSQVNAQTVLAEKAYMLFYVRSTLSPKIPKDICGASITPQPASSDTQLSTTLSGSTVGHRNGNTNGSFNRVVSKPHLKFGSIAAFNGRSTSLVTHNNNNGAEHSVNGKSEIEVRFHHKSESPESNGLSGSDQVSSATTKFEATTDTPVYGPQPRPSLGMGITQGVRAPVSSISTDGLSAVSGQTQVTVHDPVGDTNLRQNGFSSEETSSCVLGNHGMRNRKSLSDEQDKGLPEDRKLSQKRLREEGCGSSSATTDGKGVGTAGDVIEKPASTSTEHMSELEKLKTALAKEGREQLQRSGWCEKLKESMRAAKKQKAIGEQLCSKEIDKAMIRKQLIVEVQESFKLQVPRALKEHLVGQLRTFFMPKES